MIDARTIPDPVISVIVCTRNRAGEILNAVNSILVSDHPHFELLVVDESEDDITAEALAPLQQGNSRLRYLRLTGPGKARALNYALSHARGQFLALTDDDCEMASDCLSALVTAFDADPGLVIVFGDVRTVPHQNAQGHIPKCRFFETHTIRHPADFLRIRIRHGGAWLNFGIGANMAIRSAALRAIKGWDSCLGPGEKFPSGDDHDLTFRLLKAGYGVHFSPAARVVHHGVRPRAGMGQYARQVGCGFGASCVKHLKCGTLYHGSVRSIAYHSVRFCLESLQGEHSVGMSFVRGWISGFFGGLRHPVDRRTCRFQGSHSATPAPTKTSELAI